MLTRHGKKTAILLGILLLLMSVLFGHAAAAASPDDLLGRWERFGDGAEGTTVFIEKEGNGYRAKLENVMGTLVELGFQANDIKWKDVVWVSGSYYTGKDMFRYEGTHDYEYRNSSMAINSNGILEMTVSNDGDANTTVIIGSSQTWRKLPGAKKIILQIDNPLMNVDGILKEIDPGKGTYPQLINDRTVLPIRAIIEELGGAIGWDANENKVTLTLGSKVIELWIGNNTTRINGVEKQTEVAPLIINSRTMLPLRYVIDNLGYKVQWNGTTREVTILNSESGDEYAATLTAWAADFAAEVNSRTYDDGICKSTREFEWVMAPFVRDSQVLGASRIWAIDEYYAGPNKGTTNRYVTNESYDASNPGPYITVDELLRKYP